MGTLAPVYSDVPGQASEPEPGPARPCPTLKSPTLVRAFAGSGPGLELLKARARGLSPGLVVKKFCHTDTQKLIKQVIVFLRIPFLQT